VDSATKTTPCYGVKLLSVSLQRKVHGFNSERVQYSNKLHEWIRPAPRAYDLRRQRQYGVPTSVKTEVRKNKEKRRTQCCFEASHTPYGPGLS
jgi:hypothetical protein